MSVRKYTKESVKEIYHKLCLDNGNMPTPKIPGGLQHNIVKFYGGKYELERELGYHQWEKLPPIITVAEQLPKPIENPNFYLKRFGDYEKGYVGDEEFLVREMRVGSYRVREFSEPRIKKVSELSDSDYIGVKVNDKSELYEYKGAVCGALKGNKVVKKTIDVNDPKLWWLVGRWLGDGWIRNSPRTKRSHGAQQWVFLCCGKHELEDLLEFFEHFQISSNYHEERTVYKFKITKAEWYHFFSQFGKGAAGKFIPQKVKDLPVNLLKELVDGYLSADGYFNPKMRTYQATSIGENLMRDIKECVEKVYKQPVTFTFNKVKPKGNIEGRIVNQSNSYCIRFKKDVRKQDKAFYEDGYLWYPVTHNINVKDIKDYTDEIWKPIDFLGGNYHVSNYGRIKSLVNNNKIAKITLKQTTIPVVQTNFNNKHKAYSIAYLVWLAFGSGESLRHPTLQIGYADGDMWNCHIDNLIHLGENSLTKIEDYRAEGYGIRFQFRNGSWAVHVIIHGTKTYLGKFPTKDDAIIKISELIENTKENG